MLTWKLNAYPTYSILTYNKGQENPDRYDNQWHCFDLDHHFKMMRLPLEMVLYKSHISQIDNCSPCARSTTWAVPSSDGPTAPEEMCNPNHMEHFFLNFNQGEPVLCPEQNKTKQKGYFFWWPSTRWPCLCALYMHRRTIYNARQVIQEFFFLPGCMNLQYM